MAGREGAREGRTKVLRVGGALGAGLSPVVRVLSLFELGKDIVLDTKAGRWRGRRERKREGLPEGLSCLLRIGHPREASVAQRALQGMNEPPRPGAARLGGEEPAGEARRAGMVVVAATAKTIQRNNDNDKSHKKNSAAIY